MSADTSLVIIALARVLPFRLGRLEVRPSTGEVVWETGRETLQPRVMQVLVALAARRGEVVSRDELIAACWGGRAVGDDAINRCIANLRKLAERTGAFRVETFPRIGYRLADADAPATPHASRPAPRRRWFVLAGLASIALPLLGFALWLWLAPRVADPRIGVAPFKVVRGGVDAQALAQHLGGDIASALDSSGAPVTLAQGKASPEDPAPPHATLKLHGLVDQIPGGMDVRIFLEDVPTGFTVWTGRFQRSGPPDQLRAEAAAAATEATYAALMPTLQKGFKLDPAALALFIYGTELLLNPQVLRAGEARRALEQVTAMAPGFAAGHGELAVALVNDSNRAQPPERQVLMARAGREAQAAISIAPAAAGSAYDALFLISRAQSPKDLIAAEDHLLEGLRRAPEAPFLNKRECGLLTEVGRAAAALSYCQRAKAMRPLAGATRQSYAHALYAAGEQALAQSAINEAIGFNPDHGPTRLFRFELQAFSGSAQEALKILLNPETAPQPFNPEGIAALRSFLIARITGNPRDADRAISNLRSVAVRRRLSLRYAVLAAAILGRPDDAYAMLNDPAFDATLTRFGVEFLMEPSAASLRRDPRFWAVAERAGLVRYWTLRKQWPDFCRGAMGQATCQAAVQSAPL